MSVRPAAEVLEGTFVKLSCSSNANPAATHTWYRGNQMLLSRGPVLDLTDLGPEDGGNYSCRSHNLYGGKESSPIFIDVQCECDTRAGPGLSGFERRSPQVCVTAII